MEIDSQSAERAKNFAHQEAYKQAHEIRRKWENYIWQWNILLTILAAIFVKWTEQGSNFSLIQKLILTLIAGFVLAIFFNVFRARVLMKELEKTIRSFHVLMGNHLPIVPLELDENLFGFKKLSSTKLALICHFASVVVFVIIAIYAWTQ